MANREGRFFGNLLRKISELPKVSKALSEAAEWLGFEEDDGAEPVSPEKVEAKRYSYTWFHEQMAPGLKVVVGLFIGYQLALLGIMYGLGWERPPQWIPMGPILTFGLWLLLRSIAKAAQPQTDPMAVKLRLLATSLFWWGWLSLAETAISWLLKFFLGWHF